ncbi:c-type cytochrome [Actibacterium sp. MT2.3-13A]|uniref:c-type cytochrome n=1 Tax=Actibacterium sp. MT2.3-13A TaxID=2828332 RepID=UPI001BA725AD|nr:c-type cytochrome [Actibacterium sp. MT2.3-13A]
MKTSWISAAAAAAIAIPCAAQAQDMEIGQSEYMNSCAQCHGASGKGDGYLAGFLNAPIPDLTALQANNGGVFPVAAVYGIIDGSAASGAHGSTDMPAWGDRYSIEGNAALGTEFSREDRAAYVRGRILTLVEYISTMQVQ